MPEEGDHVRTNRSAWDEWSTEYEEPGRRAWASDEPTWGIWSIPEYEVHLFPEETEGLDVLELGCGTGYVSAWLARRGARPIGIDNSSAQLANARRFQREFGPAFPILQADAERLPFPEDSFDLAISEYGACLWADPYRWVPEAARVLRPGGMLRFLVNGTILMLCAPDEDGVPATDRLVRPYFGTHRFEWPDGPSVEFHLGYGDWIRLLRRSGFEVEDLVELQAKDDSETRYPFVTREWAMRWPSEEVWFARKEGRLR
jgi:SAM-dependent methyltransferase